MSLSYIDPDQTARPSSSSADIGGTILRVALGIMYLAHGPLLKGMTFGLAGVAGYFESLGLPGWLAYVVFAAETVGGVCLILGWWARWVALALIPILVGSILFDHGSNGWLFSAAGGGWEYPAFLIAASLAVFFGRGWGS